VQKGGGVQRRSARIMCGCSVRRWRVAVNRLSLRGFDKELERRIRELARRERLSLNKAALLLLRRGAGLDESVDSLPTVGNALDQFIGRWSAADERRVLEGIASCEMVDEALWK